MKTEIGLLLLRIVVGITFLIHGLDKFNGGIEGTVASFVDMGFPGFLAYVVTFAEVLGGLALIIGLFTRVVSIVFAIIMGVAIYQVKLSAGFLGGYELDLVLLASSLMLALSGSRLVAVNRLLPGGLKKL
ncbi:DoxX family protein [Alkalicoccobacillus murimartini]|uniref:Membrane protein YphA (DoxX/SURF4 family) n=1 Tax=Alkalicoccobacillus murimartini TaxID=171685 RepID=A0ABT9YBM8_9BACI|nr:DoxX family protein [Alkalicoccobacillus murimartini]MDQ0205238.1 putative membrane protein YphA (DoxX/SURF4 family) [Alkalicoccobacillus murimartini]